MGTFAKNGKSGHAERWVRAAKKPRFRRTNRSYVIVRIMVSIKEATEKAIAFAREVLDPDRARDIRLEEVQSGTLDGAETWLITLSMVLPDQGTLVVGFGSPKREYKSFTVLKSNGEVKSMKIRELTGA
jgi:hypothetical protein